jgi:hypothetical protein
LLKLHLHVGAHKTATTHFQYVLEANQHLYHSDIKYIRMKELRNNLRWHNGCIDIASCGTYLDKIMTSSPTLVVSEENLSGETKDIYKQQFSYSDIENRLASFKGFTQGFDEIEVWFGIRSMGGFLPSIYCESLRYGGFKKFEEVYAKNYTQIWLPVIKSIRHVFPSSRINVIKYENYSASLPSIIERIFGENKNWEYLEGERPRPSMNHYACNMMEVGACLIPQKISPYVVQGLSNLLDNNGMGHKFAPFNENQMDEFLNIYLKDIKAIKQLENIIVY